MLGASQRSGGARGHRGVGRGAQDALAEHEPAGGEEHPRTAHEPLMEMLTRSWRPARCVPLLILIMSAPKAWCVRPHVDLDHLASFRKMLSFALGTLGGLTATYSWTVA